MSAEWTAERLDALPEGTVVEWEGAYYSWALHDAPGSLYGWLSDRGERWSSAEIVKSSEGSIRVASAPIDVLLTHGGLLGSIAIRLGAAWDDGNATGLDGWTGPARGSEPDDYAIRHRERTVDRLSDEIASAIRVAIGHATGGAA